MAGKKLGAEYEREQKQNRNHWRGTGEQADWGAVDGAAIHAAVVAATNCGWAVRFGYTRDGGAYTLGVLGDGEPYTEYVRPTEDIHLALTALTEYCQRQGGRGG